MDAETIKRFKEEVGKMTAASQLELIMALRDAAIESAEEEHTEAQQALSQKKVTLDQLKELK